MRILPIITPAIPKYNTCSAPPPPQQNKKQRIDTVQFSGRIHESFPKFFLKDILMCGLPCPVCGKNMIPLELLNEPAVDALKLFDANVKNMTEINKIIFYKMAELAPKHPQKNMQDILKMLHSKAESLLIKEESLILNELFLISGELPKNKFKEMQTLINKTIDSLYQPNPFSKKKFKRKSAITAFDDFALTLKDDNTRVKIMSTIRRLPTSDNSTNAFIVKYSSHSPEEIGMKLHNKDFATMEHVIPDSEGGKIIIWECSEDNGARGCKSLKQQISEHPEMIENFQKHIDRLIEIYYDKDVPLTVAYQKELLKEYIFTLKNEFVISSQDKLNADISRLGKIPPVMIQKEIKRISEMGYINYLRNLYKLLQDK